MLNDVFIDPSDQYAMQNLAAMRDNLKLDPAADANAEKKPILPPSELVMGTGKPYKVSVAFQAADPKKRWKYHTHNKDGKVHANPFSGTTLQYTVIDSPGGQYDGFTITEYIMTMVQKNGTCSAMGVLQALGAWDKAIDNGEKLIKAIEFALLRTPVYGIDVDWIGQRVVDVPVLGGADGKTPLIGPDGNAITERQYNDVPGLDNWRGFWNMAPPTAGKIPLSRIECKNADGTPAIDAATKLPIVYSAKAQVTRRVCLSIASGASMNGSNPFAATAPQNGQYAQPGPAPLQAPAPAPYQQPPSQFQQTAPPATYAQQPQYAPPTYQQPPQQQPTQYAAPIPVEPWQQNAPAWVR